jgi:hypothetical protein
MDQKITTEEYRRRAEGIRVRVAQLNADMAQLEADLGLPPAAETITVPRAEWDKVTALFAEGYEAFQGVRGGLDRLIERHEENGRQLAATNAAIMETLDEIRAEREGKAKAGAA